MARHVQRPKDNLTLRVRHTYKNHISLKKAEGLIDRDNLCHGTSAAGGAQGPWKPGAPHITRWIMPVTPVLPSMGW